MAVAGVLAAAAPASATTFTNPATITINHGTCDAQAPATPYGSPITVAGLAGTVTDVNVTLTNVTDSIPLGRRALLVGPQGQTTLLLHEVFANGATGVTFTLDDEAAGEIPGTLASGTYKPTTSEIGCGIVNEMTAFPAPAPAPAAVSNETPHYGAALSTFDGTNPNGVWSLYVIDDSDEPSVGFHGSIGGWSLDITTSQPQTYASAVLGDTPAGFWRFGEPSGTRLLDSSPSANNGTYLKGVALGQPGAIAFDPDSAATFDGVEISAASPIQLARRRQHVHDRGLDQARLGRQVADADEQGLPGPRHERRRRQPGVAAQAQRHDDREVASAASRSARSITTSSSRRTGPGRDR